MKAHLSRNSESFR